MKIGVIGLGSIGMRHARNLLDMKHKVMAFDPRDCAGDVYDGVSLTSRAKVMGEAQAVVIASPSGEHLEDMRACIDAGKHVFVEKPIATIRPELVSELLAYAKNKGLVVFTGTNLRFHPCVIAAEGWIMQGHIGKPLWASFICAALSVKPPYLRDGIILNTGAHEVDLALHLLGPAKVLCASAHCTEHGDDIADFVLEHESGARSSFHIDYVTKDEIREFWIAGEEKNIGVDLLGRRASLGKFTQECAGSFDDDYVAEMRAFIDRIEGKEARGATGDDGLAALEVLLDVRKKAGIA